MPHWVGTLVSPAFPGSDVTKLLSLLGKCPCMCETCTASYLSIDVLVGCTQPHSPTPGGRTLSMLHDVEVSGVSCRRHWRRCTALQSGWRRRLHDT